MDRDGCAHLPSALWTAFSATLGESGLEDLVVLMKSSGAIGGESEEEAELHFATRFPNSYARTQRLLVSGEGACLQVARSLVTLFHGDTVAILDAPSGSGPASIALVTTIAAMRQHGQIPSLPLKVLLVFADISGRALNLAESVVEWVVPHWTAAGIECSTRMIHWDAKSLDSTRAMRKSFRVAAQDYSQRVVLRAAFSGECGKNSDVFDQYSKSLLFLRDLESDHDGPSGLRSTMFLEIEPQDGNTKKFQRFLKSKVDFGSEGEWVTIKGEFFNVHKDTSHSLNLSFRAYRSETEGCARSWQRSTNAETLVLRVVNYWRQRHFPTYLGCRVLLDQIRLPYGRDLLLDSCANALNIRRELRFHGFRAFRGVDATGSPRERECIALSPFSAFAEIPALEELRTHPEFRNRATVYSYQWSVGPTASFHFQYYYQGYRQRDEAVGASIDTSGPDCSVYVFDLKQFYPSLPLEEVIRRLPGEGVAHTRAYLEVLARGGLKSLPIGPAISHPIANFLLAPFDTVLEGAFDGCYHRYVDDIIVVAPSGLDEYVRSKVNEAIDATHLRLELNEDKSDTLTAQEWSLGADYIKADGHDPFFELNDRIRIFLWRHPSEFDTLEQFMQSNAFGIPMRAVRADLAYAPMLHRTRRRLRAEFKNDTCLTLVQAARECRKHYFSRFESALNGSQSEPQSPTVARRREQFLCSVVAKLLFLGTRSQLCAVVQKLGGRHGTLHYEKIAVALAHAKSIRDHFPAVARFGSRVVEWTIELWRARGFPIPALGEFESATGLGDESLVVAIAHGFVDRPSAGISGGMGDSTISQMWSQLAQGKKSSGTGEFAEGSFEAEIDRLLTCSGRSATSELLASRYSNSEPFAFDPNWWNS